LQLEPLSGPLEGGTALTVDGENLGLSANDTLVSVAGLDCDTVEYLSAVRYMRILTYLFQLPIVLK